MRTFERAVIINSLCLAAAAAASVVACNTTNSETPTDDGGTVEETGSSSGDLPDGSTPDSTVVEPPKACAKNEECPSGVCNLATKLCAAANCKDGVKNGTETDIDCGADCGKCDALKKCKLAADCVSGVCKDTGTGLQCQTPTNTDTVKNGNETGIDCGGTGNPKCANAQGCKGREDCESDYCKAGICTAILPADGVQNGTETDIDCGGAGNARCADALKCLVDSDCNSDVCTGQICQAPTYTDGKKNGAETDVDCGGDPTLTYRCATGLNCLAGNDCTSLGCNEAKKCAAGRSCTNPGGYGATTCGLGGAGGVGAAAWEDCCSKAPVVPTAGPTAGQTIMLDKYQVTAGRMRVFLESIGYDVRGYVQGARAAGKIPAIPGNAARTVLEPAWDPYLPTSFEGNNNADEVADCSQSDTTTPTGNVCKPGTQQAGIYTAVKRHLGGIIFKGNDQTSTGCFVGAPGTHAFRFPDGAQDGAAPALNQADYDTKSMQCVPYLVAQAFCVWDGGRLELGQEWVSAWGGNPPWSAETTQTPAAPSQRQKLDNVGNPVACTTVAECGNVAGQPATYSCTGNKCVLAGGDRTYWGCRFPWATDANHPACGLTWPATTTIEYADYQYTYEYPKQTSNDYIVFISAPGRTRGRGPAGHADLIGNNYGLTSNVTYNDDPFVATHGWNASGSWEVHGYSKPANGMSRTSNLLNKYGKLGLRCAYTP